MTFVTLTPEGEQYLETKLSLGEMRVVRAYLQCATNRECGERLNISEKTIKFHLTSIYDKLGVVNGHTFLIALVPHLLHVSTGKSKGAVTRKDRVNHLPFGSST